jgi:choline dehydrogenase-like flavoprotein
MHVPEFSTTASQPKPRTAYMSTLTLLMRPVSRGNVVRITLDLYGYAAKRLLQHVQSATALTPPRIDLRYLDNEADLKLLVEAMKFTRKLSETEPLASLIVAPIDPTPDATSDDALAAYIRKNVESAHHPIGKSPPAFPFGLIPIYLVSQVLRLCYLFGTEV